MLTKLVLILSTATFGACNPFPADQTKETKTCPQWEHLLEEHNPGWDIKKMSRIMWRESNCRPEVRSRTRDTGLMQINDINHRYLTDRLNTRIDSNTLTNPELNVAAAAALWQYWDQHTNNGYQPWRTR